MYDEASFHHMKCSLIKNNIQQIETVVKEIGRNRLSSPALAFKSVSDEEISLIIQKAEKNSPLGNSQEVHFLVVTITTESLKFFIF